jgi:drug/metabolite transporter (DMT)-like permease
MITKRINTIWLPILAIIIYIFTWVGNCECYQGIANGWLTKNPYDKPVYMTWNAYCYLLMGFVLLLPYVRWCKGYSLSHYFFTVWPGKLGFRKTLLASFAMMYILILLNILWVYGLVNISVATANAVNQTQTGMTVAFSVWLLGDRFVCSEGIGIAISLVGVFLIVVPPLCDTTDESILNHGHKNVGILSTIASSVLWSMYQLSWRVLSEAKNHEELTRMEGLMDTIATLSMMGICNTCFGWPFIVLVHLTGLETFEPPSERWALTLNGLVEYSFDVSCAAAIFLTSPVVTAMTAPLTIPISFVWDSLMYNKPLSVRLSDVYGILFVLIGVAIVEIKPRNLKVRCCNVNSDVSENLALISSEAAVC